MSWPVSDANNNYTPLDQDKQKIKKNVYLIG